MKQSGHLNPSEETGTGCPVTSKYGGTPPNKHEGVGRQQQHIHLVNTTTDKIGTISNTRMSLPPIFKVHSK